MRIFAILALVSSLAAQTRPEDLCAIEGRIVSDVTGSPLPRVMVIATPIRGPRGPALSAYAVVTDPDGRYKIPDMLPGSYRISTQKAGFLISDYGSSEPRDPLTPAAAASRPLTLPPGKKATSIDFKLRPFGAIAGRLFDTDGEPLWHAQVGVYRWTYSNTGTRLLQRFGDGDTDDTGAFRIFNLPPGRFAVCALGPGQPNGQERSAKPEAESYVTTCYPGSETPESAVSLTVQAGQTAAGADFRMSKRTATTVRGRVTNSQAAISRGGVRLYCLSNSLVPIRYPGVGPKGEFEIYGVPAGKYRLVALVGDQTAEQDIEVIKQPVDAELTLGGGIEVSGTLKVEGDGKLETPVTIMMYDPDVNIAWRAARLSDPGAFQLTQVYRWLLHLRFTLPAGYYVQSARMGPRDVLVDGIDMRSAPTDPLEISIASGVATVTGSVTNDRNEPVSGATVLLAPKEISRAKRVDEFRTYRSNDAGTFTASNLPPGDYAVYAWASVEPRAWLNEEFMRPMGGRSVTVSAAANGSYTVDLKVIPKEVR